MQQQMAAQQPTPQPAPPAPPGKPGKPGPPDGTAMNAALAQGHLQPAAPPPVPGQALQGAVQSGQLVPGAAAEQQQQAEMANLPSIDDLLAKNLLTPVMPAPGADST